MSDALVVGAGQIGTAIADRLLANGWRVTVATRGAAPLLTELAGRVDHVVGDHTTAAGVAAAIGTGRDLVVDTIAFDAADAARLLVHRADVGRYLMISSASVYADGEGRTLDRSGGDGGFPCFDGSVAETQPVVDSGPATYATRKRAMELAMLDAGVAVTVLRPCAVYGRWSRSPREWWFVKRLLDGRIRIPLAFAGESRFQPSAAANIAALAAVVAGLPGQRILNAADADAPSVREIGEAVMAALGRRADLVPVAGGGAGAVGMTPWSVPRAFLISDRESRTLGYAPVVDHAEGTRAACAWLVDSVPLEGWQAVLTGLSAYPNDLFDYAAEDRWFAEAAR